jgi:hypothetical protein
MTRSISQQPFFTQISRIPPNSSTAICAKFRKTISKLCRGAFDVDFANFLAKRGQELWLLGFAARKLAGFRHQFFRLNEVDYGFTGQYH